MKVPQNVTECVCFLCVRPRDHYLFGGTAFFMSVPALESPELSFIYLVTAKHCIEAAQRQGQILHVRVNTKGGKSEYLQINDDWILSETSDVGVIPILDLPDGREVFAIAEKMSVTDETIRDKNIGIGDELLVVGLFT